MYKNGLILLVLSFVCLFPYGTRSEGKSRIDLELDNEPEINQSIERDLYTLGKVDIETFDKNSIVNIRFDRILKLEKLDISDHKTFIQISLPDTIITESGNFMSSDSPYISKIASFQVTATDGAIRLFVNEDASLINKSIITDVLGNRIILTLDYSVLEKEGVFLHKRKKLISGTPSVKEIVKRTKVRNDITDPVELINKESEKPADSIPVYGKDDSGLKEKLTIVSIFSGVMLFGLLLIYYLRGKGLRRTKEGESGNQLAIKTISSCNLAPKQKLTLVQVGSDQILLGVSPDGINYLTTVGQMAQNQPAEPRRVVPQGYGSIEGATQQRLKVEKRKVPEIPESTGKTHKLGSTGRASSPRPTSRQTSGSSRQLNRPERGVNRTRVTQSGAGYPQGYEKQNVPGRKNLDSLETKKGNRDLASARSIDDVTKMIRSKLRNLPT